MASAPPFLHAASLTHDLSNANPNITQGAPNITSPEAFKQNLEIARVNLGRIENLAKSVLSGIQNAYHPSQNPSQTQADLVLLHEQMNLLSHHFRSSGVGSLPILMPNASVRPEKVITKEVEGDVKKLFKEIERKANSAGDVENLLGTSGGVELGRKGL